MKPIFVEKKDKEFDFETNLNPRVRDLIAEL